MSFTVDNNGRIYARFGVTGTSGEINVPNAYDGKEVPLPCPTCLRASIRENDPDLANTLMIEVVNEPVRGRVTDVVLRCQNEDCEFAIHA